MQKTDERLIWKWQKFILANKLRLRVKEIKKTYNGCFYFASVCAVVSHISVWKIEFERAG